MNVWIVAVIAGTALMFTMFFVMLMLDRKRGNIEYNICQTFLGGQRWYRARGMVDVKNDGTFMAEHVILTGGKKPIGLFHQKHLKNITGKQYMMLLEEWDTGRFRPLEYRGHIKGKTIVTRLVPVVDELGKQKKDDKGKPLYRKTEDTIDTGLLKGIPNHDIDWIVRRKEKNRELLIKKEERNKWLPVLVSGGVLIIAGIMLVLVAYYMNEMSVNFKTAASQSSSGKATADTVKIIRDLLLNETYQDRLENLDRPPSRS